MTTFDTDFDPLTAGPLDLVELLAGISPARAIEAFLNLAGRAEDNDDAQIADAIRSELLDVVDDMGMGAQTNFAEALS